MIYLFNVFINLFIHNSFKNKNIYNTRYRIMKCNTFFKKKKIMKSVVSPKVCILKCCFYNNFI